MRLPVVTLTTLIGLVGLYFMLPSNRKDQVGQVTICYPEDVDISQKAGTNPARKVAEWYLSGVAQSNTGTLFTVGRLPYVGIACRSIQDKLIPRDKLPGDIGLEGQYYAFLPFGKTKAYRQPTFRSRYDAAGMILTSPFVTTSTDAGSSHSSGINIPNMYGTSLTSSPVQTETCPDTTAKPGKMEFSFVTEDTWRELAHRITVGEITVIDQTVSRNDDELPRNIVRKPTVGPCSP